MTSIIVPTLYDHAPLQPEKEFCFFTESSLKSEGYAYAENIRVWSLIASLTIQGSVKWNGLTCFTTLTTPLDLLCARTIHSSTNALTFIH